MLGEALNSTPNLILDIDLC